MVETAPLKQEGQYIVSLAKILARQEYPFEADQQLIGTIDEGNTTRFVYFFILGGRVYFREEIIINNGRLTHKWKKASVKVLENTEVAARFLRVISRKLYDFALIL